MAYKIPIGHVDMVGKYQWWGSFGYGLVPYKVQIEDFVTTEHDIGQPSNYNYCYDIEVEGNHNYFTSLGLVSNSDHEKSFPNNSTIYIGTAGQRAFGRGDTVHRALVSEPAHYADPEKILSGLSEAVPMSGILIQESTPLGDSGKFYTDVQDCIEGKSDNRLITFFWWLCEDYTIPRGSELVMESERGELIPTPQELELMLDKGLGEDQIRWKRWKIRSMKSERKENIFPQEYIEDTESCFIGPIDKVFARVDAELQQMAVGCRDGRKDDVMEMWKPPEAGGKYIFWVDPCGGESVNPHDPHDGVILKLNPGGLEHVASLWSVEGQKSIAEKIVYWAKEYKNALLVIERNGVGKGVLNYVLTDFGYNNLYAERKPNGELTGNWGFYTTHENKARMVSDTMDAIGNDSVVTHDRKVIRQLRALIHKDTKIIPRPPARDDRAMAFMGAISITPIAALSLGTGRITSGDYVTWDRSKRQ
jgi:hypothetical protein